MIANHATIFSKYEVHNVLDWNVTLGDELLRPTRVYVKHFKELKESGIEIKGLAHITGSGFRKILRLGQFEFVIEEFPEIPPIFELIRTTGNVAWEDMFTTFNMGIGLVVVIPSSHVDKAITVLSKHDTTYRLGIVEKAKKGQVTIKPYGVKIE